MKQEILILLFLPKRRKRVNRIFKHYFKFFIVFIAIVALVVLIASFSLPQIPNDLNKISLANPTRIYSDDGRLVKTLADRQIVSTDRISKDYINAVLSIEDEGFFRHNGISKKALLRAFLVNLRAGRIKQGGSTITQQLAKNLFFSYDRTWWRKIKEVLVTLQIEQQFSKDDILNSYVNQIPFGSGVYGVELAAQTYFSKHSDELTLTESAMLAGIPNLAWRYNPYSNEEKALERKDLVLRRMFKVGYINDEQFNETKQVELTFQPLNTMWRQADYFIGEVLKSASADYGKNAINYGGFEIFTTMNSNMQYEASKSVYNGLKNLDELMGLASYEGATWAEKLNYPQAALVALDPKTGKIRAMVGGREFRRAPFNRAVSNNRQPGSSFKLFTYFAALDLNIITPKDVFVDEPVKYEIYNQTWEPRNFDKKFDGPMTIKWALMESKNVIASKLIDKITPRATVEYAHKLGIESELQEHYSLALGTAGISPLEMATAYTTVNNLGVKRQTSLVNKIVSVDNRIVGQWNMNGQNVASPQTCYLMIDMLRGVVEAGTGKSVRRLGFTRPCAGKTGTTNDYRDAWFVGFTPELVTAVWVGFDDNRIMKDKWGVGLTGGRAALPIWTAFMKNALNNTPYSDFKIPPGIEFEEVDAITGSGAIPGRQKISVALRSGRGK
jgi:1A family penicillin-binding protein